MVPILRAAAWWWSFLAWNTGRYHFHIQERMVGKKEGRGAGGGGGERWQLSAPPLKRKSLSAISMCICLSTLTCEEGFELNICNWFFSVRKSGECPLTGQPAVCHSRSSMGLVEPAWSQCPSWKWHPCCTQLEPAASSLMQAKKRSLSSHNRWMAEKFKLVGDS